MGFPTCTSNMRVYQFRHVPTKLAFSNSDHFFSAASGLHSCRFCDSAYSILYKKPCRPSNTGVYQFHPSGIREMRIVPATTTSAEVKQKVLPQARPMDSSQD